MADMEPEYSEWLIDLVTVDMWPCIDWQVTGWSSWRSGISGS
jgi:hypothetical protein